MTTPMVVIFDIDDVLMPWAERVHLACMEAGLTDKPTWTQWDMAKDYGCTLEEWLAVVNTLVVPDGIYHAPPYPGAVESIEKLYAHGADIHLVTARGFMDHAEQIREWTVEWAAKYIQFNVPATLSFAQDKGRVAKAIGATHGIDDRIRNVREMKEAGVDVYIMNQPHNQNDMFPKNRRVSSVSEFVERILGDD